MARGITAASAGRENAWLVVRELAGELKSSCSAAAAAAAVRPLTDAMDNKTSGGGRQVVADENGFSLASFKDC